MFASEEAVLLVMTLFLLGWSSVKKDTEGLGTVV
jgi:hypothetical protein